MSLASQLNEEFRSAFGGDPLVVRTPGRINLIGEHIDYNGGLVFPAAIDKAIYLAIGTSDSGTSTIVSLDLSESVNIDHSDLALKASGHWANYFIGVLRQIEERGIRVPNFNLVFGGDIPIGAGLSSSAALENGFAFGLNELFGLDLAKLEMVKISQAAEHAAVGVECGIMDQFANMFGVENQAILLNCETLEYEPVSVNLGAYELLLINTNLKHQLSDSPYNERKRQCEKGLSVLRESFPEMRSLATADLQQLESVKDKLSQTEFNRCRYVIGEQQRVLSARSALDSGDIFLFGSLLFQSHFGLRDLYEVSCPELDFLVEMAGHEPSVLGARMMGGGFGGCTINLIHQDHMKSFIADVTGKFVSQFGQAPTPIQVSLCNGTARI